MELIVITIDSFINSKGSAFGLASLNSSSKLTSSQLPSLSLYGDSLTDVHLSGLGNGNVFLYSSTTTMWNNQAPTSSSTTLSALTDCSLWSVVDGNLSVFSSASSKWVNSDTITNSILFIKNNVDGSKKNAIWIIRY